MLGLAEGRLPLAHDRVCLRHKQRIKRLSDILVLVRIFQIAEEMAQATEPRAFWSLDLMIVQGASAVRP